jgi:hypothetical protein
VDLELKAVDLELKKQQNAAGASSKLDFRIPSFPRRRESRLRYWIPACAGMTSNHNFKS